MTHFMYGTCWLILISTFINPAFASPTPQFKDYSVTEIFQGPNAPLKLEGTDARKFQTRLQGAAKQKPNFAGHYILTYWGCGTGCIDPWILDAKTGKAFSFPFTVVSFPGDDPKIERLQYQLDSKLLIVRGHLNEAEKGGVYYYLWDKDKLQRIPSEEK